MKNLKVLFSPTNQKKILYISAVKVWKVWLHSFYEMIYFMNGRSIVYESKQIKARVLKQPSIQQMMPTLRSAEVGT